MSTAAKAKKAKRARKPSAKALAEKRREYAAKFFPYIEKVARRLARRLPAHVEIDDLISSGVIGLMEAAERFDPKRVDRFEAFAEFRIRGAMLDDLRSRDTLSRDMRRLSNELREATRRLESQLGRTPDQGELADQLGLDVDELYARQQKLSGSSVVGIDDAGPDFLERTGDENAPRPLRGDRPPRGPGPPGVRHRRAAREDAAGALALLLREPEPEGDRRGPRA
jgi:RNA polymerase sigma factor (sigma-70 family)